MRLHEKDASLNGTRIESYYINGQLWNRHYYSKVNPLIEEINASRR